MRQWGRHLRLLGTLRCVEVVDDCGRGPCLSDGTANAAVLHQDMPTWGSS